MRVLVLGAYGLIGLAVSKQLARDGHQVVGLGRSARKGRALLPGAEWIEADISKHIAPEDWHAALRSVSAVVNASGALQDGFTDNVSAVQQEAIIALIKACAQSNIENFVQISAPGASQNAGTPFYRSKGAADRALKSSPLRWTIFRPGLVLAPQAYGGTSLVRMLAAVPLVQPIVMANARVQTVSVDEVAAAVGLALERDLSGGDYDLVEPGTHSLLDLVLNVRAWLGFAKPRWVLRLPTWMGQLAAKGADAAGWLGWRSALRSTSLSVLTSGVTGNPEPWAGASGRRPQSLNQTLAHLPSTVQERVYARVKLTLPLAIIVLAIFWIVSGLIGLVHHDKATAVIAHTMPPALADLFVRAGSLADILIGLLLLFRPTARLGCYASIALSSGYLAASALLTPALWADPLGPMVKVFPAIMLALLIAAALEER